MGANAERMAGYGRRSTSRRSGASATEPIYLEVPMFEFEKVEEFNGKVQQWASNLKQLLKASASGMVKNDENLSASLRVSVKKEKGEAVAVRMKMAREGVYVHVGAGRGYGGITGSEWKTRKGAKRTTNPNSMGKMGTGSRSEKQWLNPVIEAELPRLGEIVAEYFANSTVRVNHAIKVNL